METEKFLSFMLFMHIAGGTVALISGLVAILTEKGGKVHRFAGKIYFGGMTAVFVGAVTVAIGHHKDFLLMVGFFSYYLTVRGFRTLYLKQIGSGQKPVALDWLIVTISGILIAALLIYGLWILINGNGMGIPAIVFSLIGLTFLAIDVRKFFKAPPKMHWWFAHIGSMGGSYISAVTAFVVVNIQLSQYGWVLWILPTLIGSVIIARTIRKYKIQFAR